MAKRKKQPRVAYSITEIAEMVGADRSTIWRKIQRGQLRSVRILGHSMIPLDEMRRIGLLEQQP